jgi:coproporphyrinogen III oxidase
MTAYEVLSKNHKAQQLLTQGRYVAFVNYSKKLLAGLYTKGEINSAIVKCCE